MRKKGLAESAPDAKKHLAEFIRIFILQAEAVRRGEIKTRRLDEIAAALGLDA